MFSEIKGLQARLAHLEAARGRKRVVFCMKVVDLQDMATQDRLAALAYDAVEDSLLGDLIKAIPMRMDMLKDFGYPHEEIAAC